jgi:hypothetical protein
MAITGETADIKKQYANSIAQSMQERILQVEIPMAFRDASSN